MKFTSSASHLSLLTLCLGGVIALGQTSQVAIVGLSPATVAPNGALTVQMAITNTGSNIWEPISTFSCSSFYSFQGTPNEYNAFCHPYPEGAGDYGIRLEAHPLDSPDWVNTYYITDLTFPHPVAVGETVNLTKTLAASLPPGRYRLALITVVNFRYAFTSRVLNSPADSLALGSTADFVVDSDVTPPAVSTTGRLGPACSIWPPNGKMVSVGAISASDSQNAVAALRVDVTSTDPTMIPSEDVLVEGESVGPLALRLRARRSGSSGGRVYDVEITATDTVGNASVVKTQCVVPHDRGNK